MRLILIFLLFSTYFSAQIQIAQSSTIACRDTKSIVTTTTSSGTAPFSYTIHTPSCMANYTVSSPSSIATFSLLCPGLYTLTVKDINNSLIGVVNHSVVLSSTVNVGIFSGINGLDPDVICGGDAIILYTQDTMDFTQTSINWSHGATGYTTIVSPSVTTNYSLTSLYTTSTKTCTGKGYKTVTVNDCSVGIHEIELYKKIFIYPIPAQDQLNIVFDSELDLKLNQLIIYNSIGQVIREEDMEIKKNTASITTADLPNGLYYLNLNGVNKRFVIAK